MNIQRVSVGQRVTIDETTTGVVTSKRWVKDRFILTLDGTLIQQVEFGEDIPTDDKCGQCGEWVPASTRMQLIHVRTTHPESMKGALSKLGR